MTSNEPIPFLDLVTPHRELEAELVEAFRQALRAAAFVGGAQVEAFEREFAAYCGTKYCVGVANGTDAVRFALMASGVGRGDAVVTVSHTFIATVEAISQAGADDGIRGHRRADLLHEPGCARRVLQLLRNRPEHRPAAGTAHQASRSRRSCRCICTARSPTWTRSLVDCGRVTACW